MVEPLSRIHRIIRVDLLGHGGSDKSAISYRMDDQAGMVCEVLDQLAISTVLAVGHSGGGDVVVAMIEHHADRIVGAVLVATPPNLSYVRLPMTARLFSAPIFGALLWSAATDRMIRDGLAKTLAPGFPAVPDLFVTDLKGMTHSAYVKARAGVEGYRKQRDLTERIAGTGVPLMVAFGQEDQWVDPKALDGWAATTDARIESLSGVGHAPPAEAPAATAGLIASFARQFGGERTGCDE